MRACWPRLAWSSPALPRETWLDWGSPQELAASTAFPLSRVEGGEGVWGTRPSHRASQDEKEVG